MTREQKIAELKIQYPVINVGSDETGYTSLNETDYNSMIEDWANHLLEIEKQEAETKAAKETAEAKLAALGLTTEDLKALGLRGN